MSMAKPWRADYPARLRRQFPGVLISAVVAIAATFLAAHYGASAMLYALLLGLALSFLGEEGRCVEGIQSVAKTVLRIGIALLGTRITVEHMTALGGIWLAIVAGSVVLTILFGWAAARALGMPRQFGVLSGGAVAICGASAAMAIAAAQPKNEEAQRNMIFTVVGVTTLSTLAMVLYPLIVKLLGLDPRAAGIFLGGSIHDVAQVVGAGYSVSQETGDAATLIKLLRVAMLMPVVLIISTLVRMRKDIDTAGTPLLPGFVIAFAALAGINSLGWIPVPVQSVASDVSRWCLVASIAAIGMKTQLRDIVKVGLRPVLLIVLETLFIGAMMLLAIHWALPR